MEGTFGTILPRLIHSFILSFLVAFSVVSQREERERDERERERERKRRERERERDVGLMPFSRVVG